MDISEISLKCKNMKDWCVFNVLFEVPDDDSLGIETCNNIAHHSLN